MSVVDEIKERIDAVELISNHVQLKRTGRNYKGLCPFHAENTPSFVVFPDTGTWHCFGACGEGGDIFSFVMKQEGWDFRTALEELAHQAGVELQPRTPEQEAQEEEQATLHRILSTAANYYHHLLLNAPQAQAARDYVSRRGFEEQTVELFQLGYALDEWHALENYLLEKGVTREEMVTAGVLVKRDDGRVYDRFRGRLMIPIQDVRGRVIGFGARTLDPEGVPKYLNSPQTPVFDKSNTLYGLDKAAKGIRAAERSVVVEGYMDVMQAHQAGFNDVVAQLGTALSEENIQRLVRYAPRIILALDPDTAGQSATMRGLDVAREALEPEWQAVFDARGLVHLEARFSADIRVLTLPTGHDPDDLIRQDPDQWATLIDRALPLVEHYMRMVLQERDLDDPKVKAQVTETLIPVIRGVSSSVERAHYAQELARILKVDERALLEMIASAPRQRRRRPRPSQLAPQPPGPSQERASNLEAHCLQGLVQNPALLDQVNAILEEIQLKPLSTADFAAHENREIFDTWQMLIKEYNAPALEEFAQSLPAELRARVNKLINMPKLTISNQTWAQDLPTEAGQDPLNLKPERVHEELVKIVLRLRERNLKRQNEQLRFLLEDAPHTEMRPYLRQMSETGAALLRLQQRILSGAFELSSLSNPGGQERAH
jgi:DNA primase